MPLTIPGYQPPKGVQTSEELKRLQKTIGVRADGVWGPVSQKAYDDYLKRFGEPLSAQYQIEGYSAPGMVRNQTDVKRMQEILGNVDVDGIWGPETDAAYKKRRAEENMRDDAGSVLSAASVNMAAGIAAKLRLAAPVKPGGSVSLPAVDNKTALPYTGGGNTPKVQVYQQAILNALTKPAASATAMKTTNSGKTDIGKYTISSVPNAAPAKIEPLKGQDNPIQGNRLVERPVEEFDGAYKKRPSKEGDTSKDNSSLSLSGFTLSESIYDAVWYASTMLNFKTARENKEACCNLYSVVVDGKKYYFTGEIFVGELDNVITPYLSDSMWESGEVFISGLRDLKLVHYEGFMHSHPYYSNSNKYSGKFGDSLVALLSNNIFLTTPYGEIYNLTKQQALWGEIFTNPKNMTILQFLSGGLIDPPEVPFHDFQSVDTTPFSTYNQGMNHDVPKAIWQAIQNNIEKIFGPLGYDLYGAAQQFGIDAVELLSLLNLYT